MKYKTNAELRQMTSIELGEYCDVLSEAGLDTGPEWDRIYKFLEEARNEA